MPISEGFIDNSILSVNHPGKVTAAFDTRGLSGIMDLAIQKMRHFNRNHSLVIEAMSINGLGFVERCTLSLPRFYEDIAGERLPRKGVR